MGVKRTTRRQYAAIALALCAGFTANVSADAFDTVDRLNQAQFNEFSRNVSAATRYNSVSPTEFLGILGFDVGLEISSTEGDGALFDLASDGDFSGSELIIARVQIHKGLPFGFDVGASYGLIPGTEASILGGEVRYAFSRGGPVTPAIGLRGSYSQVLGVNDYSLQSAGLELGISKGFLFVTPYASAGIIRTRADAGDIDGLSSDTYNQTKYVVGVTVNLGIAVSVEIGETGGFRTVSAKTGIRF